MKILKLPVDTKISCECGCEFEFEIDDTQQQGYYTTDGLTYSKIVVDCPFCKQRHIIQEKTFGSEVDNDI